MREGQNSVRLTMTAFTEAIVALIVGNRFAAIAVLFLYRVDGVRRSYELGERTEQARIAKDLESLHAAQPPKNPIFGVDMVIFIVYAVLWFNSPLIMVLFILRAAVIVCRDVSIVSPVQEELYGDVITSFVLTTVIVVIILFY